MFQENLSIGLTHSDICQIGPQPGAAQENTLIERKVLQHRRTCAPAALKIHSHPVEILIYLSGNLFGFVLNHLVRSRLHGVASSAIIGAINLLSALRCPGTRGILESCFEMRLQSAQFGEVFVNKAVPRPDKHDEDAKENHRAFIHRATSLLPPKPQQEQQYFSIVAMLQSKSSCAKNRLK